jgi:hypothetical protein
MEFLILFGALFVGVLLGWELRERHAMRIVNQLLEEMEEQEPEATEERTKMRIEKHGEGIYAFEEETDNFIAQGTDLFDLDKAIQARFPGKKFAIREDNLKEIGVSHESV